MYTAVLIILVVLQSITLIVFALLAVLYFRRFTDAVSELSNSVAQIRERLLPLSDELRQAARDADDLIKSARTGVDSIGRLSVSVEKLVEASNLFQAAEKAVRSSRTTIASVLEGLRAGLNALRTAKPESKEVTENG